MVEYVGTQWRLIHTLGGIVHSLYCKGSGAMSGRRPQIAVVIRKPSFTMAVCGSVISLSDLSADGRSVP